MSATNNICFFNTTKFWGGGEKWHFEAAEMMSQTENNTFFICDEQGKLSKKLIGTRVKQHHISASNLSFLNVFKTQSLTDFFIKKSIDTVVFNNSKDLKLGGKAAKKAGIKRIVYRRGIAVEVKKSSLNSHLFKNVVTHFIFNSESTKELLSKHYKEVIANKKTAIIYNAITFSEVGNNPIVNSPLIIGNAGRLVEQKGQKLLIDIAKKLKKQGVSFKIEVAGEGTLYTELQEEIKKEDLSGEVELLGFVKDMRQFMNKVDLFVSTALWEGFGFVLAEAMVEKKPVLAFDLSSNPELVKDGVNGFLIPEGNTSVFAEKIRDLINDEPLRLKMGMAAYEFAKANFEKKKQFKKLLDFLS